MKILLMFLFVFPVFAGDDASGNISRSMDLSKPFSKYELQVKDKNWSTSLVKNVNYDGKVKVLHFTKTSIQVNSAEKIINGRVYQCVEKPEVFYVAEGDLMFEIGGSYPHSPGVNGFSMHWPESKNFIVCLNCRGGGVPAYKSTKIIIGKIKWQGTRYSRL
jgi:hypothetical protein